MKTIERIKYILTNSEKKLVSEKRIFEALKSIRTKSLNISLADAELAVDVYRGFLDATKREGEIL